MILPTKHIKPERALIGIGAELLQILEKEQTVSGLWDTFRRSRANSNIAQIGYDWFVLALDFLFIVDAIRFSKGVIKRNSHAA
jgi:hypothetical protein